MQCRIWKIWELKLTASASVLALSWTTTCLQLKFGSGSCSDSECHSSLGRNVGSGPYLWAWLWFQPILGYEFFWLWQYLSCFVLILGHDFCSSPSRDVILTLGPPLATILALDSAWALILSLPHLEPQLRPQPNSNVLCWLWLCIGLELQLQSHLGIWFQICSLLGP